VIRVDSSRGQLAQRASTWRGAELDLAEALGTSSKIWMNLQATRDLDAAVRRRRNAA
jgi:plasmid maintenance system antidote protein VapI